MRAMATLRWAYVCSAIVMQAYRLRLQKCRRDVRITIFQSLGAIAL